MLSVSGGGDMGRDGRKDSFATKLFLGHPHDFLECSIVLGVWPQLIEVVLSKCAQLPDRAVFQPLGDNDYCFLVVRREINWLRLPQKLVEAALQIWPNVTFMFCRFREQTYS